MAPFKCKHRKVEPKFCYNQRIHKEIPLTVVPAKARLRLLRLLGNLTKKAGEALTMLGQALGQLNLLLFMSTAHSARAPSPLQR